MKVRSIILPLVALALVLATGVVHGVISGRWGQTTDLAPLASKLESVPMTIGDWSATSSEIPEDQLERGEIVSYLSRRYVNRSRGSAVSVLVVAGRPGPISIHTPDVCFRGAGYQLQGPVSERTVDIAGDGPCRFVVGDFYRPAASTPENVRVYWAWSAGDRWNAPSNPRIEFAGSPFLLKLYVLRSTEGRNESMQDDGCVAFMNQFVPAFQNAVFGNGVEPSAGASAN